MVATLNAPTSKIYCRPEVNPMLKMSFRDLKFIEKPMRPGRKTMNEWLKMLVDNQFTIKEIEHGLAYEILRGQP